MDIYYGHPTMCYRAAEAGNMSRAAETGGGTNVTMSVVCGAIVAG
jgi:hypothetical protein